MDPVADVALADLVVVDPVVPVVVDLVDPVVVVPVDLVDVDVEAPVAETTVTRAMGCMKM